MICPKCGHKSDNFTTCSNCGIIFKKFAALEDRQRELEYEKREQKQQRIKQFMALAAGLAAVSLAAIGFSSCEREPDTPRTATPHVPTARERAEAEIAQHMGEGYDQWENGSSRFVAADNLDHFKLAKSKFVSIVQGQFGGGPKGFLISGDCHAIIGADLSRSDLQKRDRGDLSFSESALQAARRNLARAESVFEEHRTRFVQNCKDCSQSAFDAATKKYADKVDVARRELTLASRELESNRAKYEAKPQFQAKTSFGIHPVQLIEVNQRYNLSLIMLDRTSCEALDIGNPNSLKLNDPVYAYSRIRSSKLNRGNFSGLSKLTPSVPALRHNIELKPGDLGTPLLNEDGAVIGVTTKPRNDIPMAIPIDTALRILKMPL
jgi:hypothetical protein